jgi:hypothetical protein
MTADTKPQNDTVGQAARAIWLHRVNGWGEFVGMVAVPAERVRLAECEHAGYTAVWLDETWRSNIPLQVAESPAAVIELAAHPTAKCCRSEALEEDYTGAFRKLVWVVNA